MSAAAAVADVSDLALARVLLFTPATRPDRFAKAAATPADGLIIDLEDAVGPNDKDSARASVVSWLRTRSGIEREGFRICVRVNPVGTLAGCVICLRWWTWRARAWHPIRWCCPKSSRRMRLSWWRATCAGPAQRVLR